MTIPVEQLLSELENMTKQNISFVQHIRQQPETLWQQRPTNGGWTMLECIEHLNRYGNFYIPEINRRIQASTHAPALLFKSGKIGNYFAEMMLPKAKPNNMKTFKAMNPQHALLGKDTLDTFLQQQQQLLEILQRCRHTNLTKVRTAISITPLLKLRLGDTLRVVIYHNLRHIKQAEKIAAYNSSKTTRPSTIVQ
ncbi:DinB family protein [Chitinophaga sp. sic0106]|uniref:DinB family protein n=1 Tax=Chitinophaga sp. sic0106 TaxID=2854785 RepID=UPI001C486552|nr:DinB family protein [Chitinophaga sp. sic0106]MBV7530696.1 DinB family protein [Chitinophaga sp. sic0106]